MANVQQHHHVTGWTGWVGFAAILMTVTGIFHILFGLGGLFAHDWYITTSSNAWLFDSSSWGWSMIVGGVLLMLTASLLAAGNMVGRIIGALLILSSLAVNIALAPAAPVWSAIVIVADLMILYAIIAHGGEMKHLEE